MSDIVFTVFNIALSVIFVQIRLRPLGLGEIYLSDLFLNAERKREY